jgi:hypothetical protein
MHAMNMQTMHNVKPITDARAAEVEQVARWAAYLAVESGGETLREEAAAALVDAADGNEEHLRAAWLLSLRRLRQGEATRHEVDLTKLAVDRVHDTAA